MRVEVVHWRETEGRCGLSVFVDGVDVTHQLYEVIPDHDSSRSKWDESTSYKCSLASAAVALVLRDARNDAADASPFIEGE